MDSKYVNWSKEVFGEIQHRESVLMLLPPDGLYLERQEAGHSPPYGAEVRSSWNYTLTTS